MMIETGEVFSVDFGCLVLDRRQKPEREKSLFTSICNGNGGSALPSSFRPISTIQSQKRSNHSNYHHHCHHQKLWVSFDSRRLGVSFLIVDVEGRVTMMMMMMWLWLLGS